MDKEVLRDIWQGQLPLCFRLHEDDVGGMHPPDPYYMMVPRVTYFPIVLDRVVKYFNRFMDPNKSTNDDMWLDYDGQPIKWQHPIGLSWDLFGSSCDLPWRLMLHFSSFPKKDLVRCNTKSAIKTNFMSSIKEADSLKHKGNVIRNIVEKDQNQLWSSLCNDKFDQFLSINKRLMERIDNELFRYIPYRLYFPDYTYVQKIVKPCTIEPHIFCDFEKQESNSSKRSSTQLPIIYDSEFVISKAHKCSHSTTEIEKTSKRNCEHRFSTLLDLIHISFKDRLDDLVTVSKAQEREESPSEAGGNPKASLIDVRHFKYRFLSHGIEIPFDAPLHWLSENMSYPDNFLHICAVRKNKTTEFL